jgi:hypothetical protein
MGLFELREMGFEEQLLFAKEYLPLVYEKLAERIEDDEDIVKDPNDLSPLMPSFDDNDEMFFAPNGRRADR